MASSELLVEAALLFLKALLPPAEAVPRCEDDDGFLDLMDLT